MKNVHVIPTDKPSRLSILSSGKLNFGAEIMSSSNSKLQHIYITSSDEEIKEGDWVYHKLLKSIFKIDLKEVSQEYVEERKNILKVILSTDQDLIKDGVQAIDNTLLDWFVMNQSCEEVKIESWQTKGEWKLDYEIIIPSEEPNPCKDIVINDKATIDVPFHNKHIRFENLTSEQAGYLIQVSEFYQLNSTRRSAVVPKEEPKQETPEEREPYWDLVDAKAEQNNRIDLDAYANGVLDGAKWQQERMYSEKEVESLLHKFMQHRHPDWHGWSTTKWFEQYKKK